MRDPERIPVVLARVEEYWRRHPDLRLTQLLWNLAAEATEDANRNNAAFFFREDDEIVRRFDRLLT